MIEEIEIISDFRYIIKLKYQKMNDNEYMMKSYSKKFLTL